MIILYLIIDSYYSHTTFDSRTSMSQFLGAKVPCWLTKLLDLQLKVLSYLQYQSCTIPDACKQSSDFLSDIFWIKKCLRKDKATPSVEKCFGSTIGSQVKRAHIFFLGAIDVFLDYFKNFLFGNIRIVDSRGKLLLLKLEPTHHGWYYDHSSCWWEYWEKLFDVVNCASDIGVKSFAGKFRGGDGFTEVDSYCSVGHYPVQLNVTSL